MFNMATKTFTTRLTISTATKTLAFNPVNNGLYTVYGTGNIVARLNTNTGAAMSTTTLVVNPSPASPSPSSIIPAGLVIDYTNTVYVSDTSHTTVYTVTSSTASNTAEGGGLFSPYSLPMRLTLTPFFTSGLTSPGPLAVDRANNLYICDSTNVLMVSKQGSLVSTLTFSPYSLASPQSIAVDASNNVYVLGNTLLLYNSATGTTISYSAANVYGIAFNPRVGNIILNTKTSSTGLTIFTTLNSNTQSVPINASGTQFVMDSVGNYYVINATTNSIYVYSYTGSYMTTLTTTYATIGSIAIGVDASGNIWTLGGNVWTVPTAKSEIIYILGLGYNGTGHHYMHQRQTHKISREEIPSS